MAEFSDRGSSRVVVLDDDLREPESKRTFWHYKTLTHGQISEADRRSTRKARGATDRDNIRFNLEVCLQALTSVDNLRKDANVYEYPSDEDGRRWFLMALPAPWLGELANKIVSEANLTEDERRD